MINIKNGLKVVWNWIAWSNQISIIGIKYCGSWEKKDKRFQICINFRDLSKASPKNDFPLSHMDILVNNIIKNVIYSFMKGFSRYNQLIIVKKDKDNTIFIMPYDIYCYKIMPSWIRKFWTCQWAIMIIFHNIMQKEIDVHMNDLESQEK